MKSIRLLVAALLFLLFVSSSPALVQADESVSRINGLYGQVLGEGPNGDRWPLSYYEWGVYITLYKYDSSFNRVWVNSTHNCWGEGSPQGCANNFGEYRFDMDWAEVPLSPGMYVAETVAQQHFVSRVHFILAGFGADVKNVLPLASLYLEVLQTTRVIDETGNLIAEGRIWNQGYTERTITASAMVSGPGRNISYIQYPVSHPDVTVPTELWTSLPIKLKVMVPQNLPDGETYCAHFIIGSGDPVAEAWACAPKRANNPPR